jgi:serine/threonine protein kinase
MQSANSKQSTGIDLSDMQKQINEAELYLTQGLFDEARQIYQQLLNKLGPLQKKAASDPAFRRSYESRRGFIQEQLAIIDRQEAEFHGDPAETKLDKPAAAPESEGNTAFNRGRAFLDIGLFADAIQEFQHAEKLGFQPIECALQIGKANIQLGKHQEGIRVLEKACKRKDLSSNDRNLLLAQMAMGYETIGDNDSARAIYQELAANDPKHLTAANKVKSLTKESHRYHLNMVKLHLQNGQFAKAIKTLSLMQSEQHVPVDKLVPLYEEVLEKDPDNTEAFKKLSAIYRQMLEKESTAADIRLKFARHLLRAGQLDNAISEYLVVILEDTPQKMTALSELGAALLEEQEYDRILELLGDALHWVESVEPGPETLNYYYLLGTACEKKSLYDKAQDYFNRASALDPDHERIRAKMETYTQVPLTSQGEALLRLKLDAKLQYQILEKLGQDEIHQIFKVSEVPSGTIRIAKTLLSNFSGEAKVKDFMVKWAHLQVAMENRNITRVLDVAESEGQYYLIMEDFQSTLEEVLQGKTNLPLAEAVPLARALLNALAYAHSHRGTDKVLRKIFHLALNPRRVLINGPIASAKIADFGLITQLGSMLNVTPNYEDFSPYELAYMAPEQFERSPARMPDKMKQAADLYSFGLVFYKMITGKLPFEGPAPEDFKKQHNEQYPVPPRVFISSIPAEIDEAILKCLHKDPKKRWRTPTELDLALEKIRL